jgi:citrate lyase subunit beta/citryl-CoA lyase
MLSKARSIDAGEIVLDLEDAVLADRKSEALAAAVAALGEGGFQAPSVTVRVNAPGSRWAHEELIALAAAAPALRSVVVPKVESAGDLAFVDRLLTGAELAAGRERPLKVQALIETARGISELVEITTASERLEAIILGYVDLAASLGRSPAGAVDLELWLPAQDAFLTAARAAGIRAVDGAFLAIADLDGLTASARRAAALGFDAKWAIHPAQLDVIAGAFTPSVEEIERAQSVLAALAAGAQDGSGAVMFEGEMLDEPVRLAAVRTLARAGRAPGVQR